MTFYFADPPDETEVSRCIPIFFVHVMYQVACMLLAVDRDVPSEESRENLGIVKKILLRVNARWRLAGKLCNTMLIIANIETVWKS